MGIIERSSIILIGVIVAIILLLLYPLQNNTGWSTEDDDTSVSLCQMYVQSDHPNAFDDQILLSLLATLKMHDFQIGQPVWGSLTTRLYLCEHPLKAGVKQSTIDNELNNVLKSSGESSNRFTWSCA